MQKYYFEDYRTSPKEIDSLGTISGAGGGCFPAGTLVKTNSGFTPIEHINPGQLIIAYDRFGELDFAYVSANHEHKVGTFQDDIYFISSNGVSLFEKGITGNHAVYDPITNEHKEIKEFSIGDSLVDLEGNFHTIDEITIQTNADFNASVYNLTVEPQHTFLVGKEIPIRVHNGGGGKSGGGSARAAQEAPNSLRSSAIAKILEVISHGEIVGVVGGAKGVFFNNTVLQNADNSWNFQGVTYDERKGLVSQSYIPGFNAIEAEVAIPGTIITSTGVVEQLPDSGIDAARITIRLTDGLWSQNTSNGDLNGYSVSYNIYTKERSSSTWGLVLSKTISGKSTSAYEISHRVSKPSGATYWDVKVTRTAAEDSSASTKSIIAFARLTEIIEEIETYNKIAYVGLTVPATSTGNQIPVRGYLVQGIKVQVPVNYDPLTQSYGASYWNGSFKTAWTDNPAWILYDLITNTEYGVADFLGQSVDVDIWAFYEASLYNDCVSWNGSSYTTNLISDGIGGYERRYVFNGVIATQQDAWQLLHAVASNMRAVLVMKGSQVSLLQDRPKTSKRIINTSNVIDGMFIYAGTETTSRATAINCTYNDVNDRYLPKTITEPSAETKLNSWYGNADTRYGYNSKDIIAYGCTTQSQARRMAKWALYTEINQPELVSFSMALNIVDLAVGDVISIMDDNYISDTNDYLTGRVESISGTTVTLGNPIKLVAGHTYTFGVMSIDYESIVEGTVTTAAGTVSTITLASALPAGDYTNHEFFCFSSGYIETRKFLIQSITESQKGVYAISAVLYQEAKYSAIESGTITPTTPYTIFSSVLPAVTNVMFAEVFMNDGIASHNYIDVKWDWNGHTLYNTTTTPLTITHSGTTATVNYTAHGFSNGDSIIIAGVTNSNLYNGVFTISGVTANTFNYTMTGTPSADAIGDSSILNPTAYKSLNLTSDPVTYNARWRRDNNDYKTISDIGPKNFHIPDTTPGHYEVYIEAVNPQGKKSTATYADYQYRTVAAASTLEPPTNFYVQGTTGTAFTGTHIPLTWEFPTANSSKTDTLLDYVLEVWSVDGSTKLKQYIIEPIADKYLTDGVTNNPLYKGGSFNYSLFYNTNDYGTPSRNVQIKLYSRDMIGDLSTPSIKTFTNAIPNHTNLSFTLTNGLNVEYFHITQVTPESDITGYIIAQNSTATLTGATLIDIGLNLIPSINASSPLYYAIAAYDSFGKTGLDYTSFSLGTPLSTVFDKYTFADLIFTPNSPTANKIAWTTFTVSKNGATPVTISAGNATWTTGELYVCFDSITNTIVTTTVLANAVTYAQILATYRGGTDLASGDGSAFIDGGQIVGRSVAANALIANSLTANELSTSTAVITTEAQMAAAVINNAAIKDYIQSANYNATTYEGWKFDKSGNITSFGSLDIRDSDGNAILTTGASAGVEWGKVLNKTQDNLIENPDLLNAVDNTTTCPGWQLVTNGSPTTARFITNNGPSWNSLQYVVDGTADSTDDYVQIVSNYINVDITANYCASAYFKKVSGNPKVSLMANCYDNSNTYLGSVLFSGMNGYSLTDTSFTQHYGICGPNGTAFTTGTKKIKLAVYTAYGSIGQALATRILLNAGITPTNNVNPYNVNSINNINQITSTNVSTYLADAAIQRAQIGSLNVQTADIVDANITTLKVAGNAITYPLSAYTEGATGIDYTATTLQTLVIPILQTGAATSLLVSFGFVSSLEAGDDLNCSLTSSLGTHYSNTIGHTTSSTSAKNANSMSVIISVPANTSITLTMSAWTTLGATAFGSARFITTLATKK